MVYSTGHCGQLTKYFFSVTDDAVEFKIVLTLSKFLKVAPLCSSHQKRRLGKDKPGKTIGGSINVL